MSNARFVVLGLAGSLRRDSFNRRLLVAAAALAPQHVVVEEHPLGRIPLYNADLDREPLPAPVFRLKQAIEQADGLLIVSPEYNAGIPGPLKNAIDWASRPAYRSPLVGKPVALMGGSPGRRGTQRALDSLREVLASTLAEPLHTALSIAQVHEKLRGTEVADGQLADSISSLLRELRATLLERAEQAEEHAAGERERVLAG